jgi:hypothetical protein
MMVLKLGGFDGAESLDRIPNVETLERLDEGPRIAVLEFPCDMAHQHHLKVDDIRQPDTKGGGGFVGSDCYFHVWFVVV